jgi:hypothetical protein
MPGILVYGMERGLRELREVKKLQGSDGSRPDVQGELHADADKAAVTAAGELEDWM